MEQDKRTKEKWRIQGWHEIRCLAAEANRCMHFVLKRKGWKNICFFLKSVSSKEAGSWRKTRGKRDFTPFIQKGSTHIHPPSQILLELPELQIISRNYKKTHHLSPNSPRTKAWGERHFPVAGTGKQWAHIASLEDDFYTHVSLLSTPFAVSQS